MRNRTVVALLLAVATLTIRPAAQCLPTGWCPTQYKTVPDQGWNNILWSNHLGQFVLYANEDGNTVSPWENAFRGYSWQTSPNLNLNLWTTLSSANDSSATAPLQNRACLDPTTQPSGIGASDTQIVVDFGGQPGGRCSVNVTPSLPATGMPQSGVLAIGDEDVSYSQCDELQPSLIVGSCPPGLKQARFDNLVRGLRAAAGHIAASPHAPGADVFVQPANPTGEDHPADRHPYGNVVEDTLRGQVLVFSGTEETYGYQDLFWFDTDWHYIPQFQNYPPYLFGGGQQASIYDSLHDAVLMFGGTHDGTAMFVAPRSCPTTAYINGQPCVANKFYQTSPKPATATNPQGYTFGLPAASTSPRAVWDGSVSRMLAFGGGSATVLLSVVQQYDAGTGEWCLSTLSFGGRNTNDPACNLPPLSGPTPTPQNGQSLTFPAWLNDSQRARNLYYGGNSGGTGYIYGYNASLNAWTLYTISGGPVIPSSNSNASQSWAYDPIDDGYAYVGLLHGISRADTYQLPAATLP